MDLNYAFILSLIIFTCGIIGVLTKRNALIYFLSIELMLNAANLLFVSFANHFANNTGHVFVFFVLVIAAAEAAIGLAIMIHLFRQKRSVDLDQFNQLKG